MENNVLDELKMDSVASLEKLSSTPVVKQSRPPRNPNLPEPSKEDLEHIVEILTYLDGQGWGGTWKPTVNVERGS